MTSSMPPWLRKSWWMLLLASMPAVLAIAMLLYLTGWVIATSFTDLGLFGHKATNWRWVGLDNYERLFTRRGFLESLQTTILFTLFSALIGQNLVGFWLASVLRKRKSGLKSGIEAAVMLGWLLPDIVAAFLWSATTSKSGLINSLFVVPFGFDPIAFINDYALEVVILANIWKGSAWSYLLYTAALDSVPKEVVEAATVDGAKPWQRNIYVILPMIRSHIATNCLFITIGTFAYFPLIFAMTGGGPGRRTEVLSVLLYKESFSVGKLGYGSAISVAMLVIVGCLSIFYLRLLREPK